ncbi:MAG: class I SAM-dependent methyltransferase [Bacteroidales bacterium]|nr:class I SAM-dependent methyltransferase [Bacteroidales bacterium]
MKNSMITLQKEKETLLIPLYGKALESKKKSPVLFDAKAIEIIENINYDFSSLKIPGKTNTMMCLRAKLFDNFTSAFLKSRNNSVVIHLGCGLDSRYNRINNLEVDWYDLDYEEVIDLRQSFYQESEKYHLIASSVTKSEWIKRIPVSAENYLVIAEGLFMYLKEDEIKELLHLIKQRVGNYTLIFDTYSVYTAKRVKNHPSIKKTGAKIYWGIDKPDKLRDWDKEIIFNKEILFTSNEELDKLGYATKLIYKIAHLFPIARNAQRILVFQV